MDCVITLPAIAKFSHGAMSILVASFLSVSPDSVRVSGEWPEGTEPPASPAKVTLSVPDGSNCGLINSHIARNYNPQKSDEEEAHERGKNELNNRLLETQTIQDILGRLDALEGN